MPQENDVSEHRDRGLRGGHDRRQDAHRPGDERAVEGQEADDRERTRGDAGPDGRRADLHAHDDACGDEHHRGDRVVHRRHRDDGHASGREPADEVGHAVEQARRQGEDDDRHVTTLLR